MLEISRRNRKSVEVKKISEEFRFYAVEHLSHEPFDAVRLSRDFDQLTAVLLVT